MPSEQLPAETVAIRGWDPDAEAAGGCLLDGLMAAMLRTGLQATALGQAVDEVNRMVSSLALRVRKAVPVGLL